MSMTRRSTTALQRAAALAIGAIAIASCGDVARNVPVPGAAPVVVPESSSDDDLFTIRTTVASQVTDDAAPATLPAAVPANTASTNTASTGAVPATTIPPDTIPSDTIQPDTIPVTAPPVLTPPETGVPTGVAPSISGWAAFDLHLMTVLNAGSPAVSATVMRNGEVLHEVALGQRTRTGDPVEIGDRYRVASISKVVTSITVLRLVEQGLIGIDEPVGARLATLVGVTSPTAGVEQMTVRHLLTHRSGLGQYENLMFRRQVESCQQAGAAGLSRDLERSPGTTMRYSNLNFCLLGLLVEHVTGRPYEDVVRAEVLAPLGVEGMRLAGTFDVRDGDVQHDSDEGRNYMEVLGAAGSWIASPTEVATIIDSLDLTTPGWKPLTAASVEAMSTITEDPPLPPEVAATTSTTLEPIPPPTRGYGMGLMIFGPNSFGHTGTLESAHAMTARQADGLTWAITVSGDHPSSTRDLAGIIAEALRYAGPV